MTENTITLQTIYGEVVLDNLIPEQEVVAHYWKTENEAFRTFYNDRRPSIAEPLYVRLDPREPHPSCTTGALAPEFKKVVMHVISFGELCDDGGHMFAHEIGHALLNVRGRASVLRINNTSGSDPVATSLTSFVEDQFVERMLKPYGFTLEHDRPARFEWIRYLDLFGLTSPEQPRTKYVALILGLKAALGHWIDEFYAEDNLPSDPKLALFPDVQKAVKRINADAARYDLETVTGGRAFYEATLKYYGIRDMFRIIS